MTSTPEFSRTTIRPRWRSYRALVAYPPSRIAAIRASASATSCSVIAIYSNPSDAQACKFAQRHFDPVQHARTETEALTHYLRSVGTMTEEHRLTTIAFDVNMSGTMIVGPNHDPQATNAHQRRHTGSHQEPKGWEITVVTKRGRASQRDPFGPSGNKPHSGFLIPEAAATSAAKSDASFSIPSPSWKRT